MDVLKAVQTYVQKMVTDVPGMKVLLLDAHTVRRLALCDVWVDTIDTDRFARYDAERAALS